MKDENRVMYMQKSLVLLVSDEAQDVWEVGLEAAEKLIGQGLKASSVD